MFREAIRFTTAETGFNSRLIEKDYFCSVLLEHLTGGECALSFKGGTLLAKVYSGFFRLSEDLDFSISVPTDATRGNRSRAVAPVKAMIAAMATRLPIFRLEEALAGSNNSTQYNGIVSYPSVLAAQRELIKIEVGVREPTLTEVHVGQANTLLLNPVTGTPLVDTFRIACLSYSESMAEKLRAGLCRREVAIRDFFDIDHAVRTGGLNLQDAALLDLLRNKLAIDGTGPVDVSPRRLDHLRLQVDAQLRPVLRPREFQQFDLDRAFALVAAVAERLS